MTADGAPSSACSTSSFRPLLSVFEPDRLELLKGPPAVRRAHLDQVVAAIWPLRANDRREYSRVLAQRNALLARIRSGRASRRDARRLGPRAGDAGARRARAPRRGRRAARASRSPQRAAQLGLNGDAALEYRPRSRAADADEFVAELQATPGVRPRARLHRARPAPRRARDPARRPRAAPVRLPGRAAPGAARAAARRARRARRANAGARR